MAANNRGNMRPTSRSPPFLAIGLFVALIILGFNYWNLSVKNGEQYNEISVMERELKILNAKNTAVEKRAEAKDDKVNYLEEQLNKEKGTASEKAAALAAAQNERESLVQAKAALQAEFDVLKEKVPLCEKEVESMRSSLEAAKVELENLKNAPAPKQTCGDSECSKYVTLSRDTVLEELLNTVGAEALIALYKSGKNVGKFASQLKTYAESQAANANNNPVNAGQQGNVPQPNNMGGQQVQDQAGQQNVVAEQQPIGQGEAGQQPVQPGNDGTAADQKQGQDNQQPAADVQGENKQLANNDAQGQDPNVAGNNMQQPQEPQGQVAAPIVGGATNSNDEGVSETKNAFKQAEKKSRKDVGVTPVAHPNLSSQKSVEKGENGVNVTKETKSKLSSQKMVETTGKDHVNVTLKGQVTLTLPKSGDSVIKGSDPANMATSNKDEAEQVPKPNTKTDEEGGPDEKKDGDGKDDNVNDDANNDYDDNEDGAGAVQADGDLNNGDGGVDNVADPALDRDDKKDEYDEEDDEDEEENNLEVDDDDYNDEDANVEELKKDETGVEEMRMEKDNADNN